MTFSFLTQLDSGHDPKGPDRRGWNRMAIHSMEPSERCLLRPRSRQAALDFLRGMFLPALATYYGDCTHPEKQCAKCVRGTREREAWRPEWIIREDHDKQVRLLDNARLGFAAPGRCFVSWAALLDEVNVPELQRKSDETGFYWRERA